MGLLRFSIFDAVEKSVKYSIRAIYFEPYDMSTLLPDVFFELKIENLAAAFSLFTFHLSF